MGDFTGRGSKPRGGRPIGPSPLRPIGELSAFLGIKIAAADLSFSPPWRWYLFRERRGLLLEQTEPQKDGDGLALAIMRSYFAASILSGMAFYWLDRFTYQRKVWTGAHVGLALEVGECGRSRLLRDTGAAATRYSHIGAPGQYVRLRMPIRPACRVGLPIGGYPARQPLAQSRLGSREIAKQERQYER
jgi:hypothetical protein